MPEADKRIDEDDLDMGSDVENDVSACDGQAAAKKKKRRPKKKPAAAKPAEEVQLPTGVPEVKNDKFVRLGAWAEDKDSKQTWPPTISVDQYIEKGKFALGEILEHPGANNTGRTTNAEKRELERAEEVNYDDIRRAAECHRQTRKYVQSIIEPGMPLLDLCQKLEKTSKTLIAGSGLAAGWAFPTGVSINNCAAHFTPNYGMDPICMNADDIMKVDFGVHVGGRLVDCAFTVAFNPKFDPLVAATKDATNMGLKMAGVDAKFSEVGAAIEEVIRSYEFEDKGKTIPIKPIENLNGHTVDVYRIHAGKSLPIVKRERCLDFMEEGEVYAIETFASTGKGKVVDNGECSHYMMDYEYGQMAKARRPQPRSSNARTLLEGIEKNFGTLAFCRRWLDDAGLTRHLLSLKTLCEQQIVTPYPPLCDVEGSYTSQFEHTVILRPTCKEVVTRGSDY